MPAEIPTKPLSTLPVKAEGETFEVRMPIKNISDFAFTDSLLVTYNLEDVNRVNHNLPYKLKRKPFMPDRPAPLQ